MWTMGCGQWDVDNGMWAMGCGQWDVDYGMWRKLERGQWDMGNRKWVIESRLGMSTWNVEIGLCDGMSTPRHTHIKTLNHVMAVSYHPQSR